MAFGAKLVEPLSQIFNPQGFLDLSELGRLSLAVNDVKLNGLSYGKAAAKYQLTKQRIARARKRADAGRVVGRNGRPPLLTPSALDALKELISVTAASGSAMNNDHIRTTATDLIVLSNPSMSQYIMPDRTYRDLKVSLREKGIKFGTAVSTSDARMKANNVEHLKVFFDKLDLAYKAHPEFLIEPGRIVTLDESPLHQQSEKLKIREQVAFDPSTMEGRTPRRTVVAGGSSHVSVITAACANGKLLPNGYLVTGKYPQEALIAKPHPPRVDFDHLKELFVYATECGSSLRAGMSI